METILTEKQGQRDRHGSPGVIKRLCVQYLKDLLAQMAVVTKRMTLLEQNATLDEQVAELTRELGKNSSNSHKPPSSDGVGRRKSVRKPKKRSGRKRGELLGRAGKYS